MKKPGLKKKPPFAPGYKWRVSTQAMPNGAPHHFHFEDQGRFDELVVDGWFHMEHMADNTWWMRVGESSFNITVGQNGRAVIALHNTKDIEDGD